MTASIAVIVVVSTAVVLILLMISIAASGTFRNVGFGMVTLIMLGF
jgi:hypothetical protein